MQMVGEQLGITEQFQAVDELASSESAPSKSWNAPRADDTKSPVLRRSSRPVLGWATGNLLRAVQQSADRHGQHARHHARPAEGQGRPASTIPLLVSVTLPDSQRQTKIVKDIPADQIAQEIADWIRQGCTWNHTLSAHTERRRAAKAALETLTALARHGSVPHRADLRRTTPLRLPDSSPTGAEKSSA
ncbi:MAG: hypothetical protein QM757_25615 [Paludibaculum sp.]